MIKKIVLILSVIGLIFLAACSKNDTTTGTDNGSNSDTTNYFPVNDGNYYKYSIPSISNARLRIFLFRPFH